MDFHLYLLQSTNNRFNLFYNTIFFLFSLLSQSMLSGHKQNSNLINSCEFVKIKRKNKSFLSTITSILCFLINASKFSKYNFL